MELDRKLFRYSNNAQQEQFLQLNQDGVDGESDANSDEDDQQYHSNESSNEDSGEENYEDNNGSEEEDQRYKLSDLRKNYTNQTCLDSDLSNGYDSSDNEDNDDGDKVAYKQAEEITDNGKNSSMIEKEFGKNTQSVPSSKLLANTHWCLITVLKFGEPGIVLPEGKNDLFFTIRRVLDLLLKNNERGDISRNQKKVDAVDIIKPLLTEGIVYLVLAQVSLQEKPPTIQSYINSNQCTKQQTFTILLRWLCNRGLNIEDISEKINCNINTETLCSSNPFFDLVHETLIECFMGIFLQFAISPEHIVEGIKLVNPAFDIDPIDVEDAFILWIDQVIKDYNRIVFREEYQEEEFLVQDLWRDLSDGTTIGKLIMYYDPGILSEENILFLNELGFRERHHNWRIILQCCSEKLQIIPSFEPSIIADASQDTAAFKSNFLMFLADLFRTLMILTIQGNPKQRNSKEIPKELEGDTESQEESEYSVDSEESDEENQMKHENRTSKTKIQKNVNENYFSTKNISDRLKKNTNDLIQRSVTMQSAEFLKNHNPFKSFFPELKTSHVLKNSNQSLREYKSLSVRLSKKDLVPLSSENNLKLIPETKVRESIQRSVDSALLRNYTPQHKDQSISINVSMNNSLLEDDENEVEFPLVENIKLISEIDNSGSYSHRSNIDRYNQTNSPITYDENHKEDIKNAVEEVRQSFVKIGMDLSSSLLEFSTTKEEKPLEKHLNKQTIQYEVTKEQPAKNHLDQELGMKENNLETQPVKVPDLLNLKDVEPLEPKTLKSVSLLKGSTKQKNNTYSRPRASSKKKSDAEPTWEPTKSQLIQKHSTIKQNAPVSKSYYESKERENVQVPLYDKSNKKSSSNISVEQELLEAKKENHLLRMMIMEQQVKISKERKVLKDRLEKEKFQIQQEALKNFFDISRPHNHTQPTKYSREPSIKETHKTVIEIPIHEETHNAKTREHQLKKRTLKKTPIQRDSSKKPEIESKVSYSTKNSKEKAPKNPNKTINRRRTQRSKLLSRSNWKLIKNAICHVCLAGQVNEEKKDEVVQVLTNSESDHFIILVRDDKSPVYEALYEMDNNTKICTLLCGKTWAPKILENENIKQFYRYDSGGKKFIPIPMKSFGVTTDAVTLSPLYKNKIMKVRPKRKKK